MASAHAENPQSWNRYSYTLNNPTNLIDPLGLEAECPSDRSCYYNGNNNLVYADDDGNEVEVSPNDVAPMLGLYGVPQAPGGIGSTLTAAGARLITLPLLAPAALLLAFAPLSPPLMAPTLPADRDRRRDRSGVAFVHYFAPGIVGDWAHYSVTVYTNAELSSDQGLGVTTELADYPEASVQSSLGAAGATSSHQIPLPNADAAQAFQRSSVGPAGPYNALTNSCVTYVGNVLRAGGVNNVGVTSTQNLQFFKSAGIPTQWRPNRRR